MGALDGLFGLRRLFVDGVEHPFRQALEFVSVDGSGALESSEREELDDEGKPFTIRTVALPGGGPGPTGATGPAGAPGVRQVKFVSSSNDALTGLGARDGYTPADGDVGLFVGQTNPAQNGEWAMHAGAATRPADWDTDAEVLPGQSWQVLNGLIGGGTTWRLRSGSTIAGAKVIDRIDTASAVFEIDVTKGPYFVSAIGDAAPAINRAIADCATLGGGAVRLPPVFTLLSPIEMRSNVCLLGVAGQSRITPAFAGPVVHSRGYGGFATAATLTSQQDISLVFVNTDPRSSRIDLTDAGLRIDAAAGLAVEANFTAGAAGAIISAQGKLHSSDTNSICYRLAVNGNGSVTGNVRCGGVLKTLTTAAATVTLNNTTFYYAGLFYDSTSGDVKLWVSQVGVSTSTTQVAGVTGYAATTGSGTVDQNPYEVATIGQNPGGFPSGATVDSAFSGKLASVRVGVVGYRMSPFTPVAAPLLIDVANKGVLSFIPTTANSFSNGELWRCTLGSETGSASNTMYAPVRITQAAGYCNFASVKNLNIIGQTSVLTGRCGGVQMVQALHCTIDNITVSSAYFGVKLHSNSYSGQISNLRISGHARGHCLVEISGASGITSVFGRNGLAAAGAKTIIIARRNSGINWTGSTYVTANPSAYCGILETYPQGATNYSGVAITDENSSLPWGLAGLWIGPEADGANVVFDGQLEFFNTETQPALVRNGGIYHGDQLRLAGVLTRKNQTPNVEPCVKFDVAGGSIDNVSDVRGPGLLVRATGTNAANTPLSSHPGKVQLSEPLRDLNLVAQNASIAAAPLLNAAPVKGLYRVSVYLQTTTADVTAGTVSVAIGFTDAAGAGSEVIPTAGALSMAATGRTEREFTIESSGVANITYATTVVGAPGTAQYRLRVVARRID